MKKVINSEKAPAAIGPYSQAIEANGFVFVSGQLPIDKETNEMPKTIKEQTAKSLNNIKAILEAAGLTMDNVVKTTVLMSDLNDFGLMNEAYSEFFKDAYPARAAYQVVALPKGAMVEIEAIASR